VRFGSEAECKDALVNMNGQLCGNRPMKLNAAQKKVQATLPIAAYNPVLDCSDPNNTTIFVGGLTSNVTQEALRAHFQGFGELVSVKVLPDRGCGFVQFQHRQCAIAAFSLHGSALGNSIIRLSWGKRGDTTGSLTSVAPNQAIYNPLSWTSACTPSPMYPNIQVAEDSKNAALMQMRIEPLLGEWQWRMNHGIMFEE